MKPAFSQQYQRHLDRIAFANKEYSFQDSIDRQKKIVKHLELYIIKLALKGKRCFISEQRMMDETQKLLNYTI